jgi:hypothetical protein
MKKRIKINLRQKKNIIRIKMLDNLLCHIQ